jgi:hypothetical protein
MTPLRASLPTDPGFGILAVSALVSVVVKAGSGSRSNVLRAPLRLVAVRL